MAQYSSIKHAGEIEDNLKGYFPGAILNSFAQFYSTN
jgi:hypothetical protein